MFVVGIVLVIGGLWMVWSGPTVEGLADTSRIVMISLGSANTYYADTGLTNSPNWLPVGGTYKQIAGSMGRVIAVDLANSAYYGTKYGIAGSAYNYLKIPGSVTQVSFDYPMVVGLIASKTVVYIDNVPANPQTATWAAARGAEAAKTFNYIATSDGTAIAAGTDNQLWYCKDVHIPTWINIGTGLLAGIAIKSIAYEGDEVAVVDVNGVVYFASNMGEVSENIGVAARPKGGGATAPPPATTTGPELAFVMPNWKKLASRQLKQISIRNHMGVGVGMDNNIYFAANLKDDAWAAIGAPPGGSISAEIYFPTGLNVVTFRPAVMGIRGGATPCPTGYTLNGVTCYSNCPLGYTESPDNIEKCNHTMTVEGKTSKPNSLVYASKCAAGYERVQTAPSVCVNVLDQSTTPPKPTTRGFSAVEDCPNRDEYYVKPGGEVCMTTCPSFLRPSFGTYVPPKLGLTDCDPVTYPVSVGPLPTLTPASCSDPNASMSGNECIIEAKCKSGYVLHTDKVSCIQTGFPNISGSAGNFSSPTFIEAAYKYTIPKQGAAGPWPLPTNTDDQTVNIAGITARYVRIVPPTKGGDGYINLSQIMVLDANGTNIAKGKQVTARSTFTESQASSVLVDGSTEKRGVKQVTRKYGTATLAPLTFQTVGTDRTYPSSVNLGAPIPVTGLADAQAKALATPGCTGFSITSGSSPTAQLMTITASTPSTATPPNLTYKAPSGNKNFTVVGTNRAYDNSYKIGSPIPVSGLADAQAKAIATPGCSGFSITSGSSATAQLLTITPTTPTIQNTAAYRVTDPPPSSFNLAPTPTRRYTLAPTPPPNWTVLWNSDYRGLGELNPPTSFRGTVDQVKQRCMDTPGCNTFAYFNGIGYLKNIVGDERISGVNGVTTYRLIDNDPNWTVNHRQDYAGQNDLPPFSGVRGTLAQVKAQCVATPGCTAFGYINGTGYLKNITLGVGLLSPSAGSTYSITGAIETAYHKADPNWEFAANSEYGGQGGVQGH
jgi:hypothetical protein